MKLKKARIVNFRSIKDISLDFDPSCKILVGINESGKSNVLKALNLLDNTETISTKDIREASDAEVIIEESKVDFDFELEEEDIEAIYNNLKTSFLGLNNTEYLLKEDGKQLSLKDICKELNKGVRRVNLIKNQRVTLYYVFTKNYTLLSEGSFKKPSEKCPDDFEIEFENKRYKLKALSGIKSSLLNEVPSEYLSDLTVKDIEKIIGSRVIEKINSNIPTVIFWKYDDSFLLPGRIDLNTFLEKPDSCIPLKHMFELANITDIKKEVETASNISTKGIKNLFKRVAQVGTKHLGNVWKEYNKITFELVPTDSYIDISVRDFYNSFELNQRSDGFKRFVAFLFIISCVVKSGKIFNTLILIDEPEAGLHPKGAKYLTDELIKISKNNYVVYSTHSIYMIDRKLLNRHIMLKRIREITEMEVADSSNIVNEEVIFNAMGASIFESLKERNILFEGWRDSKLFEVALSRVPAQYSLIKKAFRGIGVCYSQGVKEVDNITPLLQLANRSCMILSDSDNVSKQKQSTHQQNKMFGVWKVYQDVLNTSTAVTGEDFIKSEHILDNLQRIKFENHFNIDIKESDLPTHNRIDYISGWLSRNGVAGEYKQGLLDKFKSDIFDNLNPSQISEDYYEYLKALALLSFFDLAVPITETVITGQVD